jgi:predicted phosphoribosyltransferase
MDRLHYRAAIAWGLSMHRVSAKSVVVTRRTLTTGAAAELAYRADQKAACDAIVAHVAASLASGVPGGMQRKT